jgi:hypothetical protein
MKTCGKVELKIHEFLTSAVGRDVWSYSHHGGFNAREITSRIQWIREWGVPQCWPGGCREDKKGFPAPKKSLRTQHSARNPPVWTTKILERNLIKKNT